jgi:ketosteroid isomerase-like protein
VSDDEAVRRANAAFYAAFENLDIQRMEDVWLKEPYITCVHPGWSLLSGWGPVMASWERIFEHTFEIRIAFEDLRLRVATDLAWVIVTETIESRHYEGISSGTAFATNVFERCGTRWFMVHHQGSPVQRHIDENSDQLQ